MILETFASQWKPLARSSSAANKTSSAVTLSSNHDKPIVITFKGRTSLQLVSFEKDYNIIDRLPEDNPAFTGLLQELVRESNVSVEDASRRLASRTTTRRNRDG